MLNISVSVIQIFLSHEVCSSCFFYLEAWEWIKCLPKSLLKRKLRLYFNRQKQESGCEMRFALVLCFNWIYLLKRTKSAQELGFITIFLSFYNVLLVLTTVVSSSFASFNCQLCLQLLFFRSVLIIIIRIRKLLTQEIPKLDVADVESLKNRIRDAVSFSKIFWTFPLVLLFLS